jgi:hypothetical protein
MPAKKGLIFGCRPIIAFDGSHLESLYGGQLLCAVGRDGNDDMFPIAYAVVETECRDSWTWLWLVFWIALALLRSVDGFLCLIDRNWPY